MKQCGRWVQQAIKAGMALVAVVTAPLAWAQAADPKPWQLNMGRGVTQSAHNAYAAHMLALWVCVVIGVLVFGAMAYALFTFRKSKGVVPAQFTHNTKAEIVWTVIPVLILIVMAWPATAKLIAMYDTRDAEMTVKITGYQWMWRYEYLGENVSFTSRLARSSDRMRQSGAVPTVEHDPHYLLDVDNRLVLPVNTKVRFLITADDVIHAWWVPALGWKQDAIPGIVNEAWTSIDTPGVYRGQCAVLCGKDHGFMPIVVEAMNKQDFRKWLASRKPAPAAAAPASTPAPVAAPAAPAAVSAPDHAAAPTVPPQAQQSRPRPRPGSHVIVQTT
ncbi:cytochrome c oxidase subunit II [Xanthomonas albilineans]|uniref:Cytochrome c oxidase subunit 2 n=2 Tax=Xanthomonas albilineans TaxID=29447 RepID=D2UBE6_XANAP|nr:cytochrome c oxidase subunit II [Xanthomonas albilineans]QHQ27137.1 putative cytochrome c oxidase [Xanthomonas albilineans]CBA14935.1 putative cytochrome c oxidase, subunit II protein [Xanthomonas albilineans GPE PC73]